jgi:hypothetical protein
VLWWQNRWFHESQEEEPYLTVGGTGEGDGHWKSLRGSRIWTEPQRIHSSLEPQIRVEAVEDAQILLHAAQQDLSFPFTTAGTLSWEFFSISLAARSYLKMSMLRSQNKEMQHRPLTGVLGNSDLYWSRPTKKTSINYMLSDAHWLLCQARMRGWKERKIEKKKKESERERQRER